MRLRTLLLILTTALLYSCSASKQDHTAGWNAQQLYSAGKEEMDNGSYSVAIDYYNKLLARFPYGTLAQQSQLDLAYSLHKDREDEQALKQINTFIHTYPQHPYIDYALFLKGVIEYERNVSFFDRLVPASLSQTDPESLKEAFASFNTLITLFPESPYSEDARYRMLYIRNLLGEHTLEVGNFYLRKGAYIAAIDRAKQVLEEYEQTPSAPYALALLSRAYREIGENKLASDALRVLEQNFPEKMNDPEIQEYLNGSLKSQKGFWQRVRATPKI